MRGAKRVLARVTLDDLFADAAFVDVALSPSGKYIAAVVQDATRSGVLIIDAKTLEHANILNVGADAAAKRCAGAPRGPRPRRALFV
jgi:hypothetical protein